MKNFYSSSKEAIAYWLIAGYFTVVGTIAVVVS